MAVNINNYIDTRTKLYLVEASEKKRLSLLAEELMKSAISNLKESFEGYWRAPLSGNITDEKGDCIESLQRAKRLEVSLIFFSKLLRAAEDIMPADSHQLVQIGSTLSSLSRVSTVPSIAANQTDPKSRFRAVREAFHSIYPVERKVEFAMKRIAERGEKGAFAEKGAALLKERPLTEEQKSALAQAIESLSSISQEVAKKIAGLRGEEWFIELGTAMEGELQKFNAFEFYTTR